MAEEITRPATWVDGFHDLKELGKLKYKTLGRTGLQVSQLGFGGSGIGGVHSQTNDEISIDVVRLAIKKGINYIDTAPWYGHGRAESVLGQALLGVPRQAYYVATKVGRYKSNIDEMFDFSAERTMQSVDESLQRLKLDYVDIIQVHDLEFAPSEDIILNETLPALKKIKESGKARFIGITGYPLTLLKKIIERSPVEIDTILSYCRCCLFDNCLQKYVDYFQERNLGIINAAIVGMGLLTNKGPADWHPAEDKLKIACAKAASYCKERNVDISKLAIHFSLNQPGPATHLISVSDVDILLQNLNTVATGLTPLEEQTLKEINHEIFNPLTRTDWEDIEVNEYWKQLKKTREISPFLSDNASEK